MRVALAIVTCGLLAAQSAVATAASVNAVKGSVSVNTGSGFKAITATSVAKPGDRVMASKGGSAEIVYDNGCKVSVAPGRVVKVLASPPCNGPAGVNTAGLLPLDYAIIGAGVIGGGIAAGVLLSAGNSASP